MRGKLTSARVTVAAARAGGEQVVAVARRGERAQALHQYRACVDILTATFATAPAPATVALFDQLRIDPGSV